MNKANIFSVISVSMELFVRLQISLMNACFLPSCFSLETSSLFGTFLPCGRRVGLIRRLSLPTSRTHTHTHARTHTHTRLHARTHTRTDTDTDTHTHTHNKNKPPTTTPSLYEPPIHTQKKRKTNSVYPDEKLIISRLIWIYSVWRIFLHSGLTRNCSHLL